MPTKVTFDCKCPTSVAAINLERLDEPSDAHDLKFKKSGTKSLELSTGTHALVCRIAGEPGTDFSLTVTKGATMKPINRTISESGKAASNRDVEVE